MSSISADRVLPTSRKRSLWWWRDRGVAIAVAWLALMLLVAIFADRLTPYDYAALDLHHRLAAPLGLGGTMAHPFGSDELGREVLARLVISIRISLLIAFGATLIGAVLGITLGILAAHFRGWVEQVILGCVDFQASMPFLVLALAVLAFVGNSLSAPLRGAHWSARMGTLRACHPRACHEFQRASLCDRRTPTWRRAMAPLPAPHHAEHRLHRDRHHDACVSGRHLARERP